VASHTRYILAFVALVFLSSTAQAEPVRRALLVGINDYAAVTPLHGTINDTVAMQSLLVNRFGFESTNVKLLQNAAATHDGIVAAIRKQLIEPSQPGDVAVFYFSGHGSYMKDVSGDESDGWDETIVPQNSRQNGVFDISDDELNALFAELAGRTENVTVILDSCHSGTAGRGSVKARTVPADNRTPPPPAAARAATDDSSDFRALGANFVLLSGARAKELSYEDAFEGKPQGAFTYQLVKALRAAPDNSYRSVFPNVSERVTATFPSQHPQLEGSGLDSYVFGPRVERPESYVLVEPVDSQTVRIAAGALYGLAKNVELAIYPPGAAPIGDSAALAQAVITEVDVDTARARLRAPVAIPPHSRARLSSLGFAASPKGVHIDSSVPASMAAALAQSIGKYASLKVVAPAAASSADFRVEHDRASGSLRILARDGNALGDSLSTATANVTDVLAKNVHGWARWQSVTTLSNPYSSLNVRISARPRDAPVSAPSPATVANGSAVAIRVENLSSEKVYFAVLDLTDAGRIALLFPPQGAEETLESGGSFERLFRMSIPAGRTNVTDVFKVIASTVPFDAGVLEQGPIKGAKGRNGPNQFEQLLMDRAGALTRDSTMIRLKDWTTTQLSLRVQEASPRLAEPSFALLFDTPTKAETVASSLSNDRAICPDGAPPASCASVSPLTSDNQVLEVRSPALNATRGSGETATTSIGQAFQQAYELRARTGAQYAEPLLTVPMPEEPEAREGARGGGSAPDPIAVADDHWSIKYAGIGGAWQLIQASGKPHGQEATGILIAHPDTGFTRHPENVEGATPSPIASEKGHDYIDDDDDATDPLIADALLANPGHGTASGSVIVSPEGCQLAAHDKCVAGVAQGARLVPLRVHTSVAVFDTKRLIKALDDAAEGKRFGNVNLVSLAMGGPPSRAMLRAVRKAERNGVMILAAAGNYVRIVVWPARFDSVVAVAAINPQCHPWWGSSRGSAVDISAPGEGVWRSTFDKQHAFDIGMGAGTTFATGTTAGIAALWLAHFASDPVMAELRKQGKVTQAFRAAAGATSWRPDGAADKRPPGVSCPAGTGWQPNAFGPGIINAEALLKRPLAMPAARALDAAEDSGVPLFGSLFDTGVNAAQVEAAYRAIFSNAPLATVAQFETEILYHYTANEEVRAAVDRLVGGAEANEAGRVVRAALRAQDISQQLRDALGGA
jgi:caspase domain-containing protein/subtilase family protein